MFVHYIIISNYMNSRHWTRATLATTIELMPNRVFVNPAGIVEIIVDGDQTYGSVKEMGDAARHLCEQRKHDKQPALLLDNVLNIGKVPPEARKLVVDLIKSQSYDKLAMVGNSGTIKIGANLMLHATGRGAKVRYFISHPGAIAWLLS
jgi:hypothetical protein